MRPDEVYRTRPPAAPRQPTARRGRNRWAPEEERAIPALSDREATIADFGEQWTHYHDHDEGFYASAELLRDVFGPLLELDDLRSARVLEIGCGSGRFVRLVLAAGASRVVAVEPSAAMDVLRANTREHADRIEYLQVAGDAIPDREVDLALSIGVLHHVPDPEPVVRRAFACLRPGGRFLFWVYGREGNGAYLALLTPLRALTRRLPDALLRGVATLLNVALSLYLPLSRVLPLPLRHYLREVLGRFGWRQRTLVIFDQLNPRTARYYRRGEALALMHEAGFEDVRIHHRHGYSWTVVGTRPAA